MTQPRKSAPAFFDRSQIQAIADALGDTDEGLRGPEIADVLKVCGIPDTDPGITKRHRLFNAFVGSQNKLSHRGAILKFIRQAMNPARFARDQERFEPLRARLNMALAFTGHAVEPTGDLVKTEAVKTLRDAQRRAMELRTDLQARDVHPDVLACCKEELLVDDYFHAILEATKSVVLKIQDRTGLTVDGAVLVDQALAGEAPALAINALRTPSEISEQRGFAHLVKGIFGLFRNPTAHEARIRWGVQKRDAEEALTLVSLVHRRLDEAHMPRRA